MGSGPKPSQYEKGDLVQMACQDYYHPAGLSTNWYRRPSPWIEIAGLNIDPDTIIWVDVIVQDISSPWSIGSDVKVHHYQDVNCEWWVSAEMVEAHLRPHPSSIKKQLTATIPMATSCLECRTQFMYPVEYNHAQGRLCFSCKGTYAWKWNL